MAGYGPVAGSRPEGYSGAQASISREHSAKMQSTYAPQGYSFGGLSGPQPLPHMELQLKQGQQQLNLQEMMIEKLFGGGGFLDSLMGGFSGGGASQPGFPDTGTGSGFNIPGMPSYGGEGRPPVGAPAPGLGMPISQHGGGGISAVPGMQPFGQGRRNQLSEDFNNLAKSAQTMLTQRGFGGSSMVPDTFAEIGKQKNLSMMELEDSLFREQLQFRAAERAPMFSILQSLMGGMFG